MYHALYRKWRPNTFEDVIGQEGITTALKNQITNNKIGHAYMFTGTRGTGKTTCAKIFAQAINCLQANNGSPCNQCDICKGIQEGAITDVIEIDAASNNGVDNIRELREETAYAPSVCNYKVYIIDEVHMLSIQAFNALLKIMEEPPAHVVFILATTEIHKVPVTILSRCQRYDFGRITAEDIAQRVEKIAKEENINLTPQALQLIARLADGAMRDALSILDTCCGASNDIDEQIVRKMAGVTDKSYLFEISNAIAQFDVVNTLQIVAQLREKSIDIKRLCEELIYHYRNLMLASLPNASTLFVNIPPQEEAQYLQSNISQTNAVQAIKILGTALEKMSKSTDARIELELALVQLCTVEEIAVQSATQALPVNGPIAVFATQDNTNTTAQTAVQQPSEPKVVAQPMEQAPVQPLAQQPQSEPVLSGEVFAGWQQVKEELQQTAPSIYAAVSDSKAYFDGKRVLIDGSDLLMSLIRESELNRTAIKEAIFKITNTKYAIGPYENKKQNKQHSALDELEMLRAQGVEVEIKE